MSDIEWTDATKARFWSYVDKSGGPSACWPWKRGFFTNGYGQYRAGARKVKAHRAAYELTSGPLGDLRALHRCDHRWCCNPAHLYPGTDADNARDRVERGRGGRRGASRPGALNPAAKITAPVASAIRRRVAGGETQRSVARSVGLSQSQVGNIVRGRCWT